MAGFTTNVPVRPTDGWVQVVAAAANTEIIVRPTSKKSWAVFVGAAAPSLNTQGITFNAAQLGEGFGTFHLRNGTTSAVFVRVIDSYGYDNSEPTIFGVYREGP